MGLGLMVTELTRDLEKQVERELEAEYEKARIESKRFNKEYEEKLERQLQEEYEKYNYYNEYINYDSIIKAERQFNFITEKLSKEFNKNIQMLQTHKPVINLNLSININNCDNPNETAETVKNELNPILNFLR